MKVAVVYNRNSKNVINLFGAPNQEKIGLKTIKRISDGLKLAKHQVLTLEGGKDLVERLGEFMPRVVTGERPGMVFNLSYGIQGQARYTHVPSILEMVGIPYIGSGPLAHSLALDKVVAKMIFIQKGIPTPDFAVLDAPGFEMPDMKFPLIVKPKNEAVSFGLKVVKSEAELREAADIIFKKYQQPVLVEQYINGREINVGLLGNNPPETLPPVELVFGKGLQIYTYEDKTQRSGRQIQYKCPAPIGEKLLSEARDIAKHAFSALGCYDCARVDMRLDKNGKLYVLEINSLPSMGEHGSYTIAAEHAGLDFSALVNRLVDVASARYFGTPAPPDIQTKEKELDRQVFSFLISQRDNMERRLREWTKISSNSSDQAGLLEAHKELNTTFEEFALRPIKELTDERCAWTWETKKGMKDGTLLIGHLDVPMQTALPAQVFRKESDWIYGEGVGVSRGSLVAMEYALRALRNRRKLRLLPLGILYYSDEGRDCRFSQDIIKEAMKRVKQVIVLRPGNLENKFVSQRRGWRRYKLIVDDKTRRPGKLMKKQEAMRWVCAKIDRMGSLSSRKDRLAISCVDINTKAFPLAIPHRIEATLVLSYFDTRAADQVEDRMRRILDKGGPKWDLEMIADRPPMAKKRINDKINNSILSIAKDWDMQLSHESSLLPSVAGLAPSNVRVICGMGPVGRDLLTPLESLQRISLLQRSILLAQFLVKELQH